MGEGKTAVQTVRADFPHTAYQLASWGVSTGQVDRGEAALDELRRAQSAGVPYDLMFLDAHMPGMAGVQVAQALKHEDSLNDLCAVMMTSIQAGARTCVPRASPRR